MSEVKFMTRGEKQILIVDLSHLSDYAVLPELVEAAGRLGRNSEGSRALRSVIDLSGTKINSVVITSLKGLSSRNGRFAKATAFVGIRGFWRVLLSTFLRLSGRANHRLFHTREAALSWLEKW